MKKYTTRTRSHSHNTYEQYANDIKICLEMLNTFSSNYKLATYLFPKDVRIDTAIFYALLRYADELVDNPDKTTPYQTHTDIDACIKQWNTIIQTGKTKDVHPILRACYKLFVRKNIPLRYIDDFFIMMKQDLVQGTYQTYSDLEAYMWGSAGIVGHAMSYIIGFCDVGALSHAKSLGEAMQLANFLRDVEEDWVERRRVYIPQEDLQKNGLTPKDIADACSGCLEKDKQKALQNLVYEYSKKAEVLFEEGNKGIKLLASKRGRFCVRLASEIYRYNLVLLKKRNYSPCVQHDKGLKKIRVSKIRKIRILIKVFFIYYIFQTEK